MDYLIIVNDGGELKSMTKVEFEGRNEKLRTFMDHHINMMLDLRELDTANQKEKT